MPTQAYRREASTGLGRLQSTCASRTRGRRGLAETYLTGRAESIYVHTPVAGLALATDSVDVQAASRARERLARRGAAQPD